MQLFDVVFTGQVKPGVSVESVKQRFALLFKLTPDKVEKLFTGKPVVLKRNAETAIAEKFKLALENAGAEIQLRSLSPPEPTPDVTNNEAQEDANAWLARQVVSDTPSTSSTVEQPLEGGTFQLAPVGSDVLSPEERQVHPPVVVDISGLSLSPAGGQLLADSEKNHVPEVNVDVSHLSLAELES